MPRAYTFLKTVEPRTAITTWPEGVTIQTVCALMNLDSRFTVNDGVALAHIAPALLAPTGATLGEIMRRTGMSQGYCEKLVKSVNVATNRRGFFEATQSFKHALLDAEGVKNA